MSAYIPDHLLVDLLLKLPFDSLLRFRCVSKSWRALIDSSGFAKMHLNKANQEAANSSNGIKIISLKHDTFYTLHFDLETHDTSSTTTTTAIAKQLNCTSDLEFHGSEYGVRLSGSCNGLLCLLYRHNGKIFLWNPWIHKSWELPSFPIHETCTYGGGAYAFSIGFGYDTVNDDYKVVNRINTANCLDEDEASWYDEVYVYSTKRNTWRRMEHFVPFKASYYHSYSCPTCILANGAVHWFTRQRGSNGVGYITSFDLSTEEFCKIPGPGLEKYTYQNLRNLNGCLCLVAYYKVDGKFAADFWVMKEHGVEKSWTNLTTAVMPDPINRTLTPLALSNNKRHLVSQIERGKLFLLDLETKRISDLAIAGVASSFDSSCACIGSLVRPFKI